jgi:hypothetical protein
MERKVIRAAVPSKNGHTKLLIGLEQESINLLQTGKPLSFNAADVGLPQIDVMLFAGTTSEDMIGEFTRELAKHGITVESRMAEDRQ